MDSKYFALQGAKLGSVHAVDGTAKSSIQWFAENGTFPVSMVEDLLPKIFFDHFSTWIEIAIWECQSPNFSTCRCQKWSPSPAVSSGFWVHGLRWKTKGLVFQPWDTVEHFQKWMGKTTVYCSMSRKNQKDDFRLLALCRRTPERAFFDAEHIQIWLVGKKRDFGWNRIALQVVEKTRRLFPFKWSIASIPSIHRQHFRCF